ncbi:MAG: hypothetical protein COW18_10995 [Zetaproteobacteria bacterium CG12_big_fil_rev_8_21_14_0_65_54_13]|nr:MAG: hypothetical protein COX55_06820 [Zetaproteobacteria bacterium CG23_combo_of_CG06-09_8_20_14_all_54_7]PIW45902.1 MAG: hypothetical protein COW18_10995 [Zetaproteobacteria bacterium CG12_big_fil_rev_8_21_14_0_65_54_13]PIX53413.1 MAG: hypothetical protein COZ50_13435 [Zetaproteobacteria bacterium CG_4_10_14_3_um_filter_54_28]PJA30990.1 MAG: hypothetical protein CO188_00875 [Zetaproteobacteria bacterium CG_4_9_14_3_um_filter_54_145]
MHKICPAICLCALLLPVSTSFAGDAGSAKQSIGTLSCNILPHSGFNLLIHSTSEIRCIFTPADGTPLEHYKGETGIGLGLDVNLNKQKNVIYAVLAEQFRPGSRQLSGRYSGAGGGASFGLSAGESAPIAKRDGSIALQPINVKSSGAGIAVGFTYLYLEPDSQQ